MTPIGALPLQCQNLHLSHLDSQGGLITVDSNKGSFSFILIKQSFDWKMLPGVVINDLKELLMI